ncbi:MAG: mRNA interferase RelE/StbE [Thermoleophilaceae bacterium]|nr:mRNA interferase RelE/StbE [Thermoleophilaceae bacterium]
MARLVLVRRARRELHALDWRLRDAAENAIALLGREPEAGGQLRGRLAGLLCLHIGSYRILYELIDAGRTVRVLAIRHRSVAYRSDPRG